MATNWPFRTMWPKLDLWKLLKFCPKQKTSNWTPKYTTTTNEDSRDEENQDLPLVRYQHLPNFQICEPFQENDNHENCHETSKLRWWEKLQRDHGWPPWKNASHSIVEFLGLGLFVAFGFRHRCNEFGRGDGERDRDHGRPHCGRFMGRVFHAIPLAQDTNICMNVLPAVPTTQVQKSTCQGSNPGPSTQLHVSEDEFDFLPGEHDWALPAETAFATLLESQRNKPPTVEPSLDVLRSQIESLATQYAARIQNANAVELAKNNKIKEALTEFQEASSLGSRQAKYNLGICYENGLGVVQNLNEAALMYKEAASLGHAIAAYNLGVLHFEKKIANHNLQEAVKWMDRASRCGIKEAQRFMGLHYMNNKQLEKAASLFLASSKQNDAEAAYFLGLCYEGGLGIDENMVKAAQMFHKAAMLGNMEALYTLATYQEYGLGGLPVDEAEAHKLYEQAAGQGHPLAIKRLESRKLQLIAESLHNTLKSKKQDNMSLHESRSTPLLSPTFGGNLALLTSRIPKSSTIPYINISIIQDFALHNFKRNKSLHLEDDDDTGNNYFLNMSGCSTMQT